RAEGILVFDDPVEGLLRDGEDVLKPGVPAFLGSVLLAMQWIRRHEHDVLVDEMARQDFRRSERGRAVVPATAVKIEQRFLAGLADVLLVDAHFQLAGSVRTFPVGEMNPANEGNRAFRFEYVDVESRALRKHGTRRAAGR